MKTLLALLIPLGIACGGTPASETAPMACYLIDGGVLSSFVWEESQGVWVSNDKLSCEPGYPCAPPEHGEGSASICEPKE